MACEISNKIEISCENPQNVGEDDVELNLGNNSEILTEKSEDSSACVVESCDITSLPEEIPDNSATISDNSLISKESDLILVEKNELKLDCSDNCAMIEEKENSIDAQNSNISEIIDESMILQSTEPPCEAYDIQIKFSNRNIADLYKIKFLKFFETFIELELKSQDDLTINIKKSIDLDVASEKSVQGKESDANEACTPSKKRKKKSKSKRELFVLDVNPSPDAKSLGPRYTAKFTIDSEEAEEKERTTKRQPVCFNCGKDHMIKDCPKPKDFAKINSAKQKFKPPVVKLPSRYHLEDDQKFSQFAPGKLSDELRKALGLRSYELPNHIYGMRRLGYPPGWLEEAKLVHSNLSLFDIDGKNVETSLKRKQGLDAGKIVDFPGFNIPLEKGTKDEYRAFGVPPYSDNFSKEAMIKFFDKQFAQQEDNLETCDMEIDLETESDQAAQETVAHAQADVKLCLDSLKEDARDSPSLNELEQQKKELLAQLNNDDNPLTVEKNCDDLTVDVEESDVEERACQPSPPLNKSITMSYGTPILKSNSPFMRLPNPDNFSKDVSPVIHFENLPSSTGKYEQMTDVLAKVRNTLKKIQNGGLTDDS